MAGEGEAILYCTQCGATLVLADRFCAKCGSQIRSSQELLDVPPTGPTVAQAVSPPAASLGAASVVLGTKWLKFWNYFSLPVGGILCIFFIFAFPEPKYVFGGLSYLHFYLAYGLHRRQLWAWQLNWVMIVVTWIAGSIPDFFASAIDFWAKYFVVFLILGVFWMWPNYVYWKKRRILFSSS